MIQRLLRFVHLSSERMLEPAGQDSSFAESRRLTLRSWSSSFAGTRGLCRGVIALRRW
jgi:hypothetical protein